MAIPSKSFIIAGTHSSVGKTTIALGLMAALRKRDFTVQPFKAGPDYIDPSFHRMVCNRPSYNLDTWMMGVDGVKRTFAKAMHDADVGIIEGVMGLFDGKDGRDEEGSTAHIAKVLNLPVILIVDAGAMSRSAGALVYGYEKFDPKVKLKGVIFNRVGSDRHFYMLKQAVEDRCNAKVLGYIPRDEEISLPERHLGLVMLQDTRCKMQDTRFKKLGELIERFVDVDGILKIVDSGQWSVVRKTAQNPKSLTLATHHSPLVTRIAIAYDNAFCFYYQENLDMLKKFGAEIVFFSPLKDKRLPDDINGIYFGGGYPELYAKRLSANKSLKMQIKDLAERNIPIYAECGGLMYLGRGLKDLKGKEYDMTGLFPYVSKMFEKRMVLGYREVIAADGCPFLSKGEKIRGHEFHYSNIDEPPHRIKRVYQLAPDRIIQGLGEDSFRNKPALECFYRGEGYLYKNTLVSYIHLHFVSNPGFAEGFVEKCRGY
ncbi:MAG: cobyrinate a,c-diamide synthase [Nitrospinae bacterium]|nr:cobyrinate a,c-diamide synthase [Nitrospinota bacterium]